VHAAECGHARAGRRAALFTPAAGRGFTLLELIVTMTIVGVVAAVTVPRIAAISTQNRVLRAANVLQTEVQQAYAIAGRNRRPVKFLWNSAALQVQVTDRTEATIYRRSGFGVGSSFGFTASDVTIYPTVLTVFPNGLASDTLFMKVSKGAYSKSIRVSKSGMTRIQ
jgi:prepilin-type N-terminal cleavage/methylation domain-containing protein